LRGKRYVTDKNQLKYNLFQLSCTFDPIWIASDLTQI